MANNITDNPIIIDTASATTLISKKLKVKTIRWVSKLANAGDDLTVQDQDSNDKWVSLATGANHVESEGWPHECPFTINGLKVPTLDSGTLYIYTFNPPPHS